MKLYINKEWQIIANTQELRDLLECVRHQIWALEDKDMQNSDITKRLKVLKKDLGQIFQNLPWE